MQFVTFSNKSKNKIKKFSAKPNFKKKEKKGKSLKILEEPSGKN